MANRYTSLTPSQFSPLSLEEIMLVPSMKRKQHDDILAKQEFLRGELAKVDPLDVHLDEAVRLREEMNNKLTAQAEQLAKSGIDPNSQGQFLALNREYQNLTGPTGRIGQINQAKKLYDAERARFLESASKQYGSTRALELWDEHKNKYSGYEDPEKSKIKYIDSRGIVGVQNFDEDLKLYHSLLGQTQTSASNSGYKIVDSGQGDGSKVMVNSSGQVVHSDNINQLNEQRKLLDAKWLNETGEGFRYNQESGIDLDNFRNRFNSAINMQKETSDMSKYDVSGNFISGSGNSGSGDSEGYDNVEGVPVGEVEYAQKDVEEFKQNANKIGKLTGSNYQTDAAGAPVPTSQRVVGADEIFKKGTYERKLYDSASKLAKSKNISLNDAIDLKSKEFEAMILKPDIINNQNLFPTMLITKDINLRNANLKNDVLYGNRKLYDPKTGEVVEIDKEDLQKADFNYYGMLSPINLRNNKMPTKDQKVSPHYVLINGETYLMGRTSTELQSNNFAKVRRINDVWNSLIENSDEVITIPKEWGNLGGLKMRYDSLDVNTPIEILNNKGEVISKINNKQWIDVVSKNIK